MAHTISEFAKLFGFYEISELALEIEQKLVDEDQQEEVHQKKNKSEITGINQKIRALKSDWLKDIEPSQEEINTINGIIDYKDKKTVEEDLNKFLDFEFKDPVIKKPSICIYGS